MIVYAPSPVRLLQSSLGRLAGHPADHHVGRPFGPPFDRLAGPLNGPVHARDHESRALPSCLGGHRIGVSPGTVGSSEFRACARRSAKMLPASGDLLLRLCDFLVSDFRLSLASNRRHNEDPGQVNETQEAAPCLCRGSVGPHECLQ